MIRVKKGHWLGQPNKQQRWLKMSMCLDLYKKYLNQLYNPQNHKKTATSQHKELLKINEKELLQL